MSPRELLARLLVAWGVGAAAGSLLLFLAGVVVLVLALDPGGAGFAVWTAYLLLTPTALLGALGAAVVLWGTGPTAGLAHVPHGLVAVPGAVLAVLLVRLVLSPGAVMGVPVLVEVLACAAVAVATIPAVAATVAWARARR
ncbi:hypothetical protein N866_06500, partial [Actinotalea ferrariae CF5-4]